MWRVLVVVVWCMAVIIAPIHAMGQVPAAGSAQGQLFAQNPLVAEVARLDSDALPSLIDKLLAIRRTGQISQSRTGERPTAAEAAQISANPVFDEANRRDPDETLVLLRKTNESLRKARLGADSGNPKRLALVIGSSGDGAWSRLSTTTNDAQLIANILGKQLGFQLAMGGALIDPDRNSFKQAIKDFAHSIGPDTVALFYYAGHGKQSEGENYLVPRGAAQPDSRDDYNRELIGVDDAVLRQMQNANGRLNIIVLDACRDQSFVMAARSNSQVVQGLAPVGLSGMSGTVIIYSASPGALAKDWVHEGDTNSPFAMAFAKAITKPGVELHYALDEVQAAVRAAVATQTPEVSYFAAGRFYFLNPPIPLLPPVVPSPTIPQSGPLAALTPPLPAKPTVAKREVCMAGSQVSPVRVTPFTGAPQSGISSGTKANVGDVLSVNFRSGDSCYVTYCNPYTKTCYKGSVFIADIGDTRDAESIIANRKINKVKEITLSAFPATLRDALASRARSNHVGPSMYDESDLQNVISLVNLCSEVTEQQMNQDFKSSLTGDRTRYKKDRACRTQMLGSLVSGQIERPKRRLRVAISLGDTIYKKKYNVLVQFERNNEEDKEIVLNAETIDEAAPAYFDVYGVGVYSISY